MRRHASALPGLAVVAAVGLGWWSSPRTDVPAPVPTTAPVVAPSASVERPSVGRAGSPAAPVAKPRRPTERGVVPMLAPIVGWPAVSVQPMADADPGLDWDAVDWSSQGEIQVDAGWY